MSVTLSPTQHQVTVNPTTSVVTVTAPGPVGPQGDTGAQGPTGPTGAQGPAGSNGLITSVAITGTDGVQVDSGSPITTSSGTITLGINASSLRTHINVEDGATGDQTNAEIRTAVEAASDSNVFTDADHTKLNGIETGATADQTGAEIKAAYESESDTNAFTDAEKTKLAGIASGAEVNVQADWNASSGDALIANKPSLATVATSGSYNDLSNQPTIPSGNQIIDWTSSGAGTIHSTNIPAIALSSIQTAANESAQLALTTQEGDVVVRTDQNRTYMKNSGTAGSMADFTQILTPTDYVSASSGGTFSGNVNFTGNVTQNNASLATTGKAIAMSMVFG